MRHTVFLLLIFSCLGLRAQQGLIVTTGGDSILIEYSKIRLVQAPTRAAAATILYDLSYIRFNITASFGAFTAAADCNLFSFQDPTGKWFAVPISSIDQVKKKTGADNGYIFSEIEGARQDVVYEFQDDFWEVRDTLVACAQALSGSFPGVATDMSVTGNGTAGGPIKFVNDEDAPGPDKYYGTDTSEVKGWYDLPVGGGSTSWWLTEDGDTMHVGTGQFVNMRDSGIITILFDTLTREMTFYAVSTPTDFGSGVNGDMAIWNGATLTSKTAAQFIWENNLPYGQGTANTMTYWVNDTLLGATAITYSATQWNAAALTGSLRLATGTTAQRPGTPVIGDVRLNTTLGDLEFYNGTVWRSLAEAMNGTGTPFELAIYNAAGALSDTTFAALLSAASGVTGSGASPRVAYWSGAGTLTSDANFLWDGQLSVGTTNSVYTLDVGTGGVYVTPQSAAITGAEGAGYWDSDAPKGMWWHDGTAFRATVWGDAPSWSSTRIPFSDGSRLTSSSLLTWNNATGQMTINTATPVSGRALTVSGAVEANTYWTANTDGNGINFGTASIGILRSTSGTEKLRVNLHSGGNEGYITFQESGGTDIARIGLNNGTRSVCGNYFSGVASTDAVTYSSGNYSGGSPAGNLTIVPGAGGENNNGGTLYIRGSPLGASASFSGNTGNILIQTYEDNDSTAATTLRTHMVFSSDLGSWPTVQFLQRRATTTGTQVLTMESDTIKYRVEQIGAISTSTDGSGDVTVTHGMGTTPTAVLVTPTGTTPWIVSVHTIGGTTFKVRFYDAAGAAVLSTAVTATWLGKT